MCRIIHGICAQDGCLCAFIDQSGLRRHGAACHGPKGISSNPLWPNLAGQQQTYLANQIKAFRNGQRTDVSMQPFVANLTDQDIEDLAAYYASLSPCP